MEAEPLAANVDHMLIAIGNDVGIGRERLEDEILAGEFGGQLREGKHTREGIRYLQDRTGIGRVGSAREIATPSAARRHPLQQRSEFGREPPLQASRGHVERWTPPKTSRGERVGLIHSSRGDSE